MAPALNKTTKSLLSSHLRLSLPSVCFSTFFPVKILYTFLIPPMTHITYLSTINRLSGAQFLWVREMALPSSRTTQCREVYLGETVSADHKYGAVQDFYRSQELTSSSMGPEVRDLWTHWRWASTAWSVLFLPPSFRRCDWSNSVKTSHINDKSSS